MDNYTFTDKTKRITYVLMAAGVLGVVYGILTADSQRIWANVLVNSFFFLGIAMAATFFMALQYATESYYAVAVKRVYEAISGYLPVGAITLIAVLAVCSFSEHPLYHWMDSHTTHEFLEDGTTLNPHYDKLLAGKSAYLNLPFFWIRTLTYLGVWWFFQRLFRKRSLEEDMVGGVDVYWKNVKSAAIFLVIYGVTSSTSAWDWLMSLDAHWYSTMFGWYVFSGTWVTAMITIIIFTLYLKSKGYLPQVNEYHLHDLGKWMFAISFLWSYLWFCQFMLIWYSNIPEEVTYFMARFENYMPVMWTMFIINFSFPMLFLMSRDAKRSPTFLITVGSIIFFSHWTDVFQIVMPATVGENWHFFNPLEIGMFLGFLGLFLYVVHAQLAKAPLMVKSHPYLEETLHHEF